MQISKKMDESFDDKRCRNIFNEPRLYELKGIIG